jgi:hypothetical protein
MKVTSTLLLLTLVSSTSFAQKSSPEPKPTATLTATSTVKLQVLSPDALVAVNGRVYRVADLPMSGRAFLDSSEAQRLHSPAKPNRERTERAPQ